MPSRISFYDKVVFDNFCNIIAYLHLEQGLVVRRAERRNAHKILVGQLEKASSFERPRHRQEDDPLDLIGFM